MHYGIVVPNIGPFADLFWLMDLACEAEEKGWDGFFLWDTLHFEAEGKQVCDPWIALAAIAMRTTRLRLGTLVTPLARRRPWKLARETVTLDHLSHGRLTLGIGLGDITDKGFSSVGEETSAKVQAQIVEEGLEVLTGLWRGHPLTYHGQHYQVEDLTFLPPPMQSPRIPIWIGGYWPRKGPVRRAARWDGIYPGKINADGTLSSLTPADVVALKNTIAQIRSSEEPFDIVLGGATPGDDPEQGSSHLKPLAEAGATWWVEHLNPWRGTPEMTVQRIKLGPPYLL
jgi:alkanesulfonate monooxygenase SsuD/methylene tetrahydromethanopterin reductase-like flavin-dependent oxidoreductase (luciferase family)